MSTFTVREALEATQLELRLIAGAPIYMETQDLVPGILAVFDQNHGIGAKYSNGLVILDYDTIRVKWDEPFGWVCRGLILDPLNNWKVVAFGLAKFFNDGESRAHKLDWATTRCLEKLDGSMVQRYWNPYANEFQYSTRFQLHDDLHRNKVSSLSDMTWLQLIEKCLCGTSYGPYVFDQPKNETYVLEVMSPLNRIVVQHRAYDFKVIARRNIDTLEEGDLSRFMPKVPFEITFKDPEEARAIANQAAGTEMEGFVAVDANFNRVKIKNLNYVQLHRLKDGINSIGAIINLAKSGDYEEITLNFPEYLPALDKAIHTIQWMIGYHEEVYEQLKNIESQKEFALALAKFSVSCPSALFLTRAGKHPSVRAAFYAMRENAFIELVKGALPPSFSDMCLLPPTNVLVKAIASQTSSTM